MLHRDSLDAQTKLIREELEQCDRVTTSIVRLLDGLDDSLIALEGVLLPVHEQAKQLTTAQRNVEDTIQSVDAAIAYHQIATEADSVIESRNIKANLDEYLAWGERVTDAEAFFQKNPAIKGSDRHLKRVRALGKKVESDAMREFTQIISQQNKPLDFTHLPWPLPDDFTLMPEEDIKKLQAIAHTLDRSGNREVLLKELQPYRSSFLHLTLKKAWEENKDTGDVNVSTTRYRKGHHTNVLLMRVCSKLLQLEHQLHRTIMGSTSMREGDFCSCFHLVVHHPVEYLAKNLEKKLKEVGANKVLVVMDLMENFDLTMPMFEAVLKENIKAIEDLKRIKAIHINVRQAFAKALTDYHEEIRLFQGDKLKDGTICQIVVETLSCLKQMYQYEDTLKTLSAAELPFIDEENVSDDSLLPSLTIYLLSALVENVAKVSKQYTRQSLATLFAMNNYHHIAKLCRKGEVKVTSAFIQDTDARVQDMKKRYSDATWSKLDSHLDIAEAKRQVDKSREQMNSAANAIKTMFKNVNGACESAYHDQIKFSVPDSDLRSQLRAENVSRVIPSYEAFLQVLSKVHYSGNKAKYEKYSVEQLEKMLNGFFGEN